MQESTGSILEEVGRTLRQRSALPPYRPRPQLTASDRGKANAELRRQRELEANLIFAEANEMISSIKPAASSSSVDGDAEAQAQAQDDAMMEDEVDAALSFNASIQKGRDEQYSSSQVGESNGSIALSEVLPTILSQPMAKKARLDDDDDDEFFGDEDDVFFEQLFATDSIDWDNGSSKAAATKATTESTINDDQELESQGYDLVCKQREKHPETNGFVWSSEKQVKVAPKALEKGLMWIAKIKKEVEQVDTETGSESSSTVSSILPPPKSRRPPQPGRPVLTPVANSTLNRPSDSGWIGNVQEGKRKLQEEVETSHTPTPIAPVRPPPSIFSTPDRRLPSVRPTNSPLSQTPNPIRSASRLGSTLRTSISRQSTPIALTPSNVTPSKASLDKTRTPRISLGMTPRRAVSGNVPKFITPFKDGTNRQATPSGTQRSPDLFKIPPVNRGLSSPSVMVRPIVKRPPNSQAPPLNSIFNLDDKMSERQSLKAAFTAPESTSIDDARGSLSMEIYDAIQQILRQPKRGLKYAFGVEGQFVGREGILAILSQAVGTQVIVQSEWIDNHYILILWKLAAYTRHTLDERYWHWDEVCRQFKYRYEREFNCKHRSAIKRILREDSPSTRPMALCVFEIPPFDERLGPGQTIILTDGWYKIQAVLDRVLCLAVYGIKYQGEGARKPAVPIRRQKQKQTKEASFTVASSASKEQTKGENGQAEEVEEEEEEYVCLPYTTECDMIRIKVGTKLAIQGASLESNAEGIDPLKAFQHARIKIGGNSTKLALWDARLGFTRGAFINTIRSLSAGGGKIPLMDMIVTKLFPVAFTGYDCCPGYEDDNSGIPAEWGVAEEEERKAVWEKHREKTLLEIQQEQEEETQTLRQICEELEQAYEGLSHDDSENVIDASSCQDMLHAIITAGSAVGYLSMTQLIPKLRELALQKLKEVRETLGSETDSTIQNRIGSRKIRSFRFIRIRDATPQDHGRIGSVSSKRLQCKRGALLRIWDYAERIEAGLAVAQSEGDHFMVTNLIPSRTGAWPKIESTGDIELTSGIISTWRLVKRAAKAEE